jgi:hypothetical protein
MSDDLVKRLRDLSYNQGHDLPDKAADRIEKLVEENGVLFAANVRLNSRADLDSDGYVDRIEKLEAALREIVEQIKRYDLPAPFVTLLVMQKAEKALEGKDD